MEQGVLHSISSYDQAFADNMQSKLLRYSLQISYGMVANLMCES